MTQIKQFDKLTTTTQLLVPEGYVIVLKSELEEMTQQVGRGEWKDMKWFKSKVGIQRQDKLDEMIFRPFKDELDVESGGFVHYPEINGDPWMFHKSKTEAWLEQNFDRVFKNWSGTKYGKKESINR